ncbi:MAG TPA: 2-dehydropantoate 2-reductase N-terminal domain-containing protein, partial [Candidatus Limnocylindria bacterium]|nr:2-dehydropantoate 2-reductase N-terminal domain-containing protein [Candidatus Limnocylindria bacterium]
MIGPRPAPGTTTADRIAVIGAGAWGTTLAIRLAEMGRPVVLWAHTSAAAAELASER